MSSLTLFSLIDNEPYSIQGYGPFVPEKVVPLGMNVGEQMTATITLDEVDGMENDEIYLEDRYLGLFHDLHSGAYEFESDAALYMDRFFIHYSPMSVTGVSDDEERGSLGAFMNNEILTVRSKDDVTGSLEVMDMSGRVVYSREKVQLNPTGVQIDMTNVSDGVYIVTFVGSETTLSKKVLK